MASVHNSEKLSQARCEVMQRKLTGRQAAVAGVALAAIAVLSCFLLIIAHHGVPLGPLNSLVSDASVKWLYLGMGLGGAAFLGNLALLCKRPKPKTIDYCSVSSFLTLPEKPPVSKPPESLRYGSFLKNNALDYSSEELGSQ